MTNTNWNSEETYTITTDNMDESGFVYSIDSSSISSITTDNISTITLEDTQFMWEQKEFVDKMPSLDKVHNMCGYYPALQKAYENFQTIYKMVEQDYKGNHQEKDETPF